MKSNPLQAGMVYFPEYRLKQVGATATTEYRYGADGQKLMKGDLSFNDEYTTNGPQYQLPNNADAWLYYRDPWGRLRAVIRYRYVPGGSAVWSVEKQWHWFLGAPVEAGSTKWVGRDRLGSVRATANGNPIGGFAAGMTQSGFQQLVVIHEFMHWMGIVGPGRSNESYTLPNGDKVTGSVGISEKVKRKCF